MSQQTGACTTPLTAVYHLIVALVLRQPPLRRPAAVVLRPGGSNSNPAKHKSDGGLTRRPARHGSVEAFTSRGQSFAWRAEGHCLAEGPRTAQTPSPWGPPHRESLTRHTSHLVGRLDDALTVPFPSALQLTSIAIFAGCPTEPSAPLAECDDLSIPDKPGCGFPELRPVR